MNNVYRRALRDYHARQPHGQAALAHYANQAPPVAVDYRAPADALPPDRLLLTTATGLYTLDQQKGQCRRLLSGKFYGLTRGGGYWWVARSDCNGYRDQWVNERLSDVCRFRLSEEGLTDLQVVLCGLPGEVHQMDVWNDQLYFPHTDYNQVLTVPLSRLLATTVPLGLPACDSLLVPIESPSHLNSIWMDAESIHLIAHNFTLYSGRLSDWVAYHRSTQRWTVCPLQAHSAHNILLRGSDYWYCDSNRRQFCHNGRPVFTADKLLRGCSLSASYWYIGGSDVTYDPYQRCSSTSSLYVLDRTTYRCLHTYDFPRLGDVYEIRQWSGADFALSHPHPTAL